MAAYINFVKIAVNSDRPHNAFRGTFIFTAIFTSLVLRRWLFDEAAEVERLKDYQPTARVSASTRLQHTADTLWDCNETLCSEKGFPDKKRLIDILGDKIAVMN